ncbi:MAG: hypothetical protein WA160_08105 [Pseudobdellovibrio sp.]
MRFSFSTEAQSFYLNPKSSSSVFSKYEFKTFNAYEITSSLQFKSELSLNYTYLLTKQDQKQVVLNSNEFGFSGSSNLLDYQFGFWTLNPEGTDLNNIFDVIHGKDYRQPFASESFASFGLLLKSHVLNFDYSLFYIPKNRKSLLPDTQSPWWPRTSTLPIQNASGTFILPDDASYIYRNETEIKSPFEQNFGGTGKLSFSFIDFHLFYFSGANQIPQISPHFNIDITTSLNPLVGVIRAPVDIDLAWYKSEHLGAGISSSLGAVVLKSFCKKQKDFYTLDSSESVSCTAAIESGFNISKSTFHYFLQLNRLWRKNDVTAELETLLGFFDKSTAFGFLVDVGSESTLSGAIVYNEKSPSLLNSIRYEKNWTDRFKTSLGLNVISVQSDPLTKSYDATDNMTVKLNYSF